MADELPKRGSAGARIGLVGPMFHQEHAELLAALPEASLGRPEPWPTRFMRIHKKRRGARLPQRIAAAGCDCVVWPRCTRRSVRHRGTRSRWCWSEEVALALAASPTSSYLNSTSMKSPKAVPNQNPSRRKLQKGT